MAALTEYFDPEVSTTNSDLDLGKLLRTPNCLPLPLRQAGEHVAKRVEGTSVKGFSSVYRGPHVKEQPVEKVHPDYDNLVAHFNRGVELHGDLECLGTRLPLPDGSYDTKFTFQTYSEVGRRRKNLGSGLRTLVGKQGSFIVALWASNRPEWIITMLAAQAYNMQFTALYPSLGASTSSFILNMTESPVVVCSRDKIVALVQLKKSAGLPVLKYIVSMDPLSMDQDLGLMRYCETQGLKLLDMAQLEKLGSLNRVEMTMPTADTVHYICFTSGTTGDPKGIEITHRMSTANMVLGMTAFDPRVKGNEQLRYLSFLPLAHCYEASTVQQSLTLGGKIHFMPDPSPLKFIENLALVQPHFMIMVPRLLSKIEFALKETLSRSFVGRRVLAGIHAKVASSKDCVPTTSFLLDRVFLSKLSFKLGFGSCQGVSCGGAPVSKETLTFMRNALNVGICQGYGLTETCGGIMVTAPYETDVTCGMLGVTCEVKFKDIPEMEYLTHDEQGKELDQPQGELLLRGPQVFKKYFKNTKGTEAAMENGWFKTGDVAKLDEYGRIVIIDRVKNFFKLAQGEYVTPERVESSYMAMVPWLTQVFTHGDSLKTYLVGIAGVELDLVRSHGGSIKGCEHIGELTDEEELLKTINKPEVKRLLIQEMNRQISAQGLSGFEKLHNIKFMIEPLQLEHDTLTPTLKIKRNVAARKFGAELKELYEEGSMLKLKL